MREVYSRLIYIQRPKSEQFYKELIGQWKAGTKVYLYSNNAEELENIKQLINNKDFNFNIGLVKVNIGQEFELINGEGIETYRDQVDQLDKNSSFNIGQYEAEHSPAKNIILKAGAGTGKTYSMISRINYLIWSRKYTPEQLKEAIVMITFTNEA